MWSLSETMSCKELQYMHPTIGWASKCVKRSYLSTGSEVRLLQNSMIGSQFLDRKRWTWRIRSPTLRSRRERKGAKIGFEIVISGQTLVGQFRTYINELRSYPLFSGHIFKCSQWICRAYIMINYVFMCVCFVFGIPLIKSKAIPLSNQISPAGKSPN